MAKKSTARARTERDFLMVTDFSQVELAAVVKRAAAKLGIAAGPCYRCLFPEPPPPGLVPSCAEGGTAGAVGERVLRAAANRERRHRGRRSQST